MTKFTMHAVLCKTWLDIWTLDIGGLSNNHERSEWKNDPKHKRLRTILELCEARGVSTFCFVLYFIFSYFGGKMFGKK